MDLSIVFLGTGGSVPTAKRNTAGVLVRRGGDRLLFDCGEGTQRQMARSTGLVELDAIYLTHLHADHYLGLPGLLKTYDLHSRERELSLFGPPGTRELVALFERLVGRTRYPLHVVELAPGHAEARDGYRVLVLEADHRTRAHGYAIVEDPRPGAFDPAVARKLGVTEGPDWGTLQSGEPVQGPGGRVSPEQVMGEPRAGRKIVLSGDTRPAGGVTAAAGQADVLIHDASFSDAEADRAAETGHSTARQAGRVAREAEVRMLALVHVSSRYHVGQVADEAREEFENTIAPRDFDLIEVPFPERGEPRHVKDGARAHPEAPPPAPATALGA